MKKTLLATSLMLAFATGVSAADQTKEEKTLTEDWKATLEKSIENTVVKAGDYSVDLTLTRGDGVIKNTDIDSKKSVNLTSNSCVLYTDKTNIKADTVTIKTLSSSSSAIASYGNHTIEANSILIEANGDGLQGSGDMSGDVSLTATDTITIRSLGTNGEAIQGFKGNFNLKAKKIVLESVGGQAIGQRDTGSINITADDLVINAYQGDKGRVDDKVYAVQVKHGTLTFDVKNTLTISDNGAEGTSALGIVEDKEGNAADAKLMISAPKAVIDGNISAPKGEVEFNGNLIFEGTQAEIGKLTGSEATFTVTAPDQDIQITNANKALTLAATGEVNDAVGMQALDNIKLSGETKGVQLIAYEGMNSNEVSAELNEEGDKTNVKTTTNSIMSNVLDLASASTLSMNRILMNDVRKRMGDLRNTQETHGAWVRYDGGRLSGARDLENDFTTIQFGIDTVPVADAPRLGIAFSYTKSEADMKRGQAEMDAFSLAFYGTKMYDNGLFVDVIGRMATASTDVTVDGDKKGSMDNLALSLSGELGWRFDVTDQFYVEPQAEFTYTYVNADTLTLSEGSSYKFDSVDSLIARAGFATGYKCPNNFGDVYVRVSAVHEFLGDAAVTGGRNVHKVDGKDTWVEYGIGANFNINKNVYAWLDVERTAGATLDEDWRATAGIRYSF